LSFSVVSDLNVLCQDFSWLLWELFQKIDKNLKLTIEKSEKPGSPWNKYGYKILIEKYQSMLGRK
jgi:hypothetical protein